MMNQARHPVSEISEMNDGTRVKAIYHFGAAAGWGTLAGTVSLLSIAIFMSWGTQDGLRELAAGFVLFGLFVSVFTLAGMVAIGLPITFLLRACQRERRNLYAVLGAILGFLMITILFEMPRIHTAEELIFPVSGALAGLAAAWRWGMWREEIATSSVPTPEVPQPSKLPNPIHDLLY